MKPIQLFFFLVFFRSFSFGQSFYVKYRNGQLSNKNLSKSEISQKFLKYDFAELFTDTENSDVFGFIGDDYSRIRIKFITVTKDSSLNNIYHIYGKSLVKYNICEFKGTIEIKKIRAYKSFSMGVDSEYKNKGIKGEYAIIGSYSLSESAGQKNSGTFKGVFQTDFYLDKNFKVHYDDLNMQADGFTNNQFVGIWISYKTKITKTCNWGDFRIPNSGNFDVGAGEFSPGKNLESGWQSVVDLSKPEKKDAAKKIEEAKWWK